MKRLVLFVCGIVLLGLVRFAIAADDEPQMDSTPEYMSPKTNEPPFFKLFHADLNVASQFAYWNVNFDNDYAVLDYKSEGLAMVRLLGNVGFGSKSFLTVSYERPFSGSARQNEMLRSNTNSSSGFEKFVGGIKLDPFVDYLIPNDSLGYRLAKKALSVRFKYSEEQYFTEATAKTDISYLPFSAVIDYQTKTASGYNSLLKGEKIIARSKVTDQEITIPLVTFGTKQSLNGELLKVLEMDFRIGRYVKKWSRPSDTRVITVIGKPVAYDADFKSEGVLISLETVDVSSPGFNFDMSFRFGYNDSINSALDWKKIIPNKEISTRFYAISLAGWYNYYLNKDIMTGWAVSAGGSYSLSSMSVESAFSNSTSSQTILNDKDAFKKIFLNASYRF